MSSGGYCFIRLLCTPILILTLACLICHDVAIPSHSFRSFFVSSSKNEGRCSSQLFSEENINSN
ncbi:hypothetical protein C5167_013520 [Papaver somniferum]|uniref:Uncharacterized protein n=1 Tax=Papaver somniferum TaxID=3469 RepID=A0A4Y7J4S7_PAPSO|nr:hypothetical protein C5167_013520 [Papaver somniferum]